MRTVGSALETAAGLTTTTLAYLVTITPRSGAVVRLTNAGSDLVVDGNTHLGDPGVAIGSITHDIGQPTSVDLDIPVDGDSPVTRADLRSGMYDNATITVDLIDFTSPSGGTVRVASGRVGKVDYHDGGGAKIDFRGLWSLSMPLRIWTYGATCRARLGDEWCKVPIRPDDVERSTAYALADHVRFSSDGTTSGYGNRMFECTTAGTTAATAPTYDYTIGNTTTDGTAVFTARDGWTRHAVVSAVTNRRKFELTITEARGIDGWFDDGALKFIDGANADLAYEIRKWTQSNSQVELWVDARGVVAVGDVLEIHPGCDKTHDGTNGCNTKFDNIENMQAFPHLPGEDFAFGGYYSDQA